MADRVYPNAASNPAAPKPTSFPATKSQLYGATRPAYRPQPHHRRRGGRSCCCSFCICLSIVLLVLILIIGISSAVIYFLYRPQRPSFSVTSLKVSRFNISSSSSSSVLDSKFDLNVTATNPNKKLTFTYNPISISLSSDGVDVGDGSFPAFVHGKKSSTLLKASITSTGQQLDSNSVSTLKLKMKSKNGVPLEVELDTKVKMKMGVLQTPKVGIRVRCDGINAAPPTGNTSATASTSNAKCKVDVRFKIWKWTI